MLSLAEAVLMQELKGPFLSLCLLIDRLQFRSSKLSSQFLFLSPWTSCLTLLTGIQLFFIYTNGIREVVYKAPDWLVIYLPLFCTWACFRWDLRSHVPGIKDHAPAHTLTGQRVMASFSSPLLMATPCLYNINFF